MKKYDIGDNVTIIKGKYKGTVGYIDKLDSYRTNEIFYIVLLDTPIKTKYITINALRISCKDIQKTSYYNLIVFIKEIFNIN